ncbi:MAG TPA: O-antigen ligase family protein [Patescibacteria group bacterium]|nr:O-antigen ligase family protein [Patescibacteria group bacterium]
MGLIIEGGVYFLLLFTPFAFGGVELWALGVFQIVAGLVVAAWAWSVHDQAPGSRGLSSYRGARTAFWISAALFILLVLFQLSPLPPAWVQRLAPGTYDLYARALPGYAEGKEFEAASLPAWLLVRKGDQIPTARAPGAPAIPEPPKNGAEGIPARHSAWRGLSINTFETWQRLSLLLSLLGLFAVVSSWYRTKERIARLVAVTAFSGFAVSMFGIIQKLTWNGKLYWVREGTYGNVFGPFVNQNTYAAFAGTIFPLAVCMGLSSLRGIGKGRPGALPQLLVWGFAAVTMCCGIFYSLSRGGILSAALSLAIVAAMLLYYGKAGRELAVLGLMALAAVGFLAWIGSEKVIERVGTLKEGQSVPSLEVRMGAWQKTQELFASSPLVGTGLGSFRFAFMRFAPPGEGWWVQADNEYIELACEVGIVGGVIFLAGLVSWLAIVARPWLFRGREERYHYVGVSAGIAGLLLHSAVTANLQIPANGLMLAVAAAMLVCLTGMVSKSRQRRRPGIGSESPATTTQRDEEASS